MMIRSYVFGSGFEKRVNFNYTNSLSVIRNAFKNVCLLLANLTFMIGFGYCLGLLLYGLSGCDLADKLPVLIRIFLFNGMEW